MKKKHTTIDGVKITLPQSDLLEYLNLVGLTCVAVGEVGDEWVGRGRDLDKEVSKNWKC